MAEAVMTRRKLQIGVAVIATALTAALIVLQQPIEYDATPDGFRRTSEPRHIVAVVLVSPMDEFRAADVRETDVAVEIALRFTKFRGSTTANAVQREVDVVLRSNLGQRKVVSKNGAPIQELKAGG